MEYQRIRYFLKAAETMNFSAAAAQMYVSPQAFGKQIALLEREMGFTLFERSTRKLELTREGELCQRRLKGLVLGLEDEYAKLCEMGRDAKTKVNIGFFNAMSRSNDISPVINGLIAAFPKLDFSIYMLELKEVRRKLMDGTLDIAFTHYQGSENGWEDCEMVKIKEKRADIIVSENHVWATRRAADEAIDEAEMKKYDFVCMETNDMADEDVFHIIPSRDHINTPNYDSMVMTLTQNKAFSIAAEDDMLDPMLKLKHLPLTWHPFCFQLVMATRKNQTKEIVTEVQQTILKLLETNSL